MNTLKRPGLILRRNVFDLNRFISILVGNPKRIDDNMIVTTDESLYYAMING